jgi:hypothetical protein
VRRPLSPPPTHTHCHYPGLARVQTPHSASPYDFVQDRRVTSCCTAGLPSLRRVSIKAPIAPPFPSPLTPPPSGLHDASSTACSVITIDSSLEVRAESPMSSSFLSLHAPLCHGLRLLVAWVAEECAQPFSAP